MTSQGNPARHWILLLFLFVLHNLEEVLLDLPGWARTHVSALSDLAITRDEFALGACALVLGIALIAFVLRHRHQATVHLQRIFLAILCVVFCWHIAVSLWAGSPQPGVWSSILLLPLFLRQYRTITR